MRSPKIKWVRVRLLAEDAAALAALERENFSQAWSEEQIQRALAQENFIAFGIKKEERLLAYISFYHTLDTLEILNIAVASDFRRYGLASFLLEESLQELRKKGILKVLLEVRAGNVPAIGLYEKLSFIAMGCRPHYYTDTGEDALLYVRELSSESCG